MRAWRGASPMRHPERGLSLVELMVALTLGLLIMVALSTLFLNITRSNSELAKANAQIENGRFAIQLLQNDIAHAGFWDALQPAAPAAIHDPCLAVASWNATYKANLLGAPVLEFSGTSLPSSCFGASSSPQSNSDALVVRHANTCVAGSANCEGGDDEGPHLQVSLCTKNPPEAPYVIEMNTEANAADFALTKKDCAPASVTPLRKIISNVYYVSANTLRRVSLENGAYVNQPLIDGIEAMRFEYGIDTTGDGSPDSYASDVTCTLPCSAAEVTQIANIVAVKIYVLARSPEPTPGYTDSKTYHLGSTDFTPSTAAAGYKRHLFTTTVRLVNPSGRREAP